MSYSGGNRAGGSKAALTPAYYAPYAVQDVVEVVRDQSGARPLREQAKSQEQEQSVAVTLGLEEPEVGGITLGRVLLSNRLFDLGVLEEDSFVRDITVGVVLRKHTEGLLVLSLRKIPSRRLWDPVQECELDD